MIQFTHNIGKEISDGHNIDRDPSDTYTYTLGKGLGDAHEIFREFCVIRGIGRDIHDTHGVGRELCDTHGIGRERDVLRDMRSCASRRSQRKTSHSPRPGGTISHLEAGANCCTLNGRLKELMKSICVM